jgi:hypothetical protein
MSLRPRKASFLRQNIEMLQGLFLCTVGGHLRCGIHLGAYQAHHCTLTCLPTPSSACLSHSPPTSLLPRHHHHRPASSLVSPHPTSQCCADTITASCIQPLLQLARVISRVPSVSTTHWTVGILHHEALA